MPKSSKPPPRVPRLLLVILPGVFTALVVLCFLIWNDRSRALDAARLAQAEADDYHRRAEQAAGERGAWRSEKEELTRRAEQERNEAMQQLARTEQNLLRARAELARSKEGTADKGDKPPRPQGPSEIEKAQAAELEALRAENRRLAEGGKKLIDPAPGRVQAWQPHPAAIRSLAMSPDGRRLATTSGSVTRVWDASNGALLREWIRKDSSVRLVAFSFDNNVVAQLGADGIQILDIDNGREIRALRWNGLTEGSVCFRPGTMRLLFAGADQTLRLFDLATGGQILELHENVPVRSAAFSADGHWLAIGKDNGDVAFSELNNQSEPRIFKAHKGGILALAFSPDGERLATGGADGIVHIWNTKSGKQVAVLHGHNGPVISLDFSRDSSLVAAGGGTQAHTWDAATGKELFKVDTRTEGVAGVAFDTTGKRLFVGQGNGVRVCDVEPARQ